MKEIDNLILKYLQNGLSQSEIADKLKEIEIKPNSISSVEKKLKTIREAYGAKTLFHLGFVIASENKNN